MLYTNKDIVDGFIFMCECSIYRVSNVEGDICSLTEINNKYPPSNNYPIKYIPEELNRGTWKVYQQPEYQIF